MLHAKVETTVIFAVAKVFRWIDTQPIALLKIKVLWIGLDGSMKNL